MQAQAQPGSPTTDAATAGIRQMVDHLFRTEAGKMVSVLVRKLGIQAVEVAEDIVQETMLDAVRLWPHKGVPPNPPAWLHTVARNKAIDWLRQQRTQQEKRRDIKTALKENFTGTQSAMETFLPDEIADGQLRMMFACCHPAFAENVQLALTLNLVCGFGPDETARAFVEPVETVKKRLVRAKEKFREGEIPFEVPQGAALHPRLATVLHGLYLLFNEGYNSTRKSNPIDGELCGEAMRLALLLTHQTTLTHADTYALLALMCYQAARFDARQDADGNLLSLADQDRSRWSRELMQRGQYFFALSQYATQGGRYHVEACIARFHCEAPTYADTPWPNILKCYDALLHFQDDALVRLNRAVALAKVQGPRAALQALQALAPQLDHYYLYHAVVADCLLGTGDTAGARAAMQRAAALTQSPAEQVFLHKKLEVMGS
jgi:RNA polymerase sigma-70 factor (ECF subfamily)